MLSRWFKRSSRLEHADREVRLQAVQALTAEQAADAQANLENIVLADAELDVRLAALPHVTNPDTLNHLLADPDLASATASQIAAQILNGNLLSFNEHPAVLQARIAQATPDDLDALWPLLTSPEQGAQLALRLRDNARERLGPQLRRSSRPEEPECGPEPEQYHHQETEGHRPTKKPHRFPIGSHRLISLRGVRRNHVGSVSGPSRVGSLMELTVLR